MSLFSRKPAKVEVNVVEALGQHAASMDAETQKLLDAARAYLDGSASDEARRDFEVAALDAALDAAPRVKWLKLPLDTRR